MKVSLSIIAFVAFILVSGWFKNGLILGYAEGALPFYDIDRYLAQTEFAWGEHPGLGSVTGIITAAAPTYYILAKLQQFGIPGYVLQELVFFLLLFSSGVGIYLLTKLISPIFEEKYLLLAVFFYWFNPISLVSVWNRFLLNYIFFWGFLPLALYFFIRGIKDKKYLYSVLFVLTSIVFSFCFSSFVFVLLTGMMLFFSTFFFFSIDKKNWRFYLSYFTCTVILFILSNSWWIGQFINFTFTKTLQTNIPRFFSTIDNLGTLDALSKKMGNLTDILMFKNASFFTTSALDWVKLYLLPVSIILSVINVIPIFVTIFKSAKDKIFLFLFIFFFFTAFLMQGTNPPFGIFYYIIFKKIIFLQVFRNPFEKFGFMLPLFAAPLYGIGVGMISKKNFSYIFFFMIIFLFWGLPFFTGHVFTTSETPNYRIGYQVKVPDYYKETNEWLSKFNEMRVIEFPISDQGITYNWEKGYSGVDLPSTLFDKSVISFNTTVPFYTDIVPDLEKVLMDSNNLSKTAKLLNVRFLMTREDTDFVKRKLTDPQKIIHEMDFREKNGEIKKVKEFEKLKIWEILNYTDRRFYGANDIIASSAAKFSGVNLDNFGDSSVIFSEGMVVYSRDEIKKTKLPRLTYTKVNPTKYQIKLEDGAGPFMLVFSELFNPNWELRSKNEIINNHFRANIFANGWLINDYKDQVLTVEFAPQRWLNLGKIISIFSIFALVAFLCSVRFFKKNNF